jgi:hypothetical protein
MVERLPAKRVPMFIRSKEVTLRYRLLAILRTEPEK